MDRKSFILSLLAFIFGIRLKPKPQWHHCIMSVDSDGNKKCYIDGRRVPNLSWRILRLFQDQATKHNLDSYYMQCWTNA